MVGLPSDGLFERLWARSDRIIAYGKQTIQAQRGLDPEQANSSASLQ